MEMRDEARTDLAKPSVPGAFGYSENATGLFDCLKRKV